MNYPSSLFAEPYKHTVFLFLFICQKFSGLVLQSKKQKQLEELQLLSSPLCNWNRCSVALHRKVFWDRLIFNAPLSQREFTDIRLMQRVPAAVHFCTCTSGFLLQKFKNKVRPLELRPLEWYFILSGLHDASAWFPFVQPNTNWGK